MLLFILLFNLLVWGFIITTIIICVKDKIRFKIPCIILILFLLYFGTSIVDGDLLFVFGFWIGLKISSSTFLIPAGAIIYWCIRKRLIINTDTGTVSLDQEPGQPSIESDSSDSDLPKAE